MQKKIVAFNSGKSRGISLQELATKVSEVELKELKATVSAVINNSSFKCISIDQTLRRELTEPSSKDEGQQAKRPRRETRTPKERLQEELRKKVKEMLDTFNNPKIKIENTEGGYSLTLTPEIIKDLSRKDIQLLALAVEEGAISKIDTQLSKTKSSFKYESKTTDIKADEVIDYKKLASLISKQSIPLPKQCQVEFNQQPLDESTIAYSSNESFNERLGLSSTYYLTASIFSPAPERKRIAKLQITDNGLCFVQDIQTGNSDILAQDVFLMARSLFGDVCKGMVLHDAATYPIQDGFAEDEPVLIKSRSARFFDFLGYYENETHGFKRLKGEVACLEAEDVRIFTQSTSDHEPLRIFESCTCQDVLEAYEKILPEIPELSPEDQVEESKTFKMLFVNPGKTEFDGTLIFKDVCLAIDSKPLKNDPTAIETARKIQHVFYQFSKSKSKSKSDNDIPRAFKQGLHHKIVYGSLFAPPRGV